MSVITGQKEFFKGIGSIGYEGPETNNALAYRWYDADKVVGGKKMKDHLRFAVAYWHSFVGNGGDPFGEPTHIYPWNEKGDAIARAKDKMDAAFEFITKLGLPYYCFHDVDVVDYTNDVIDNEKRLQAMTEYAKEKIRFNAVAPGVVDTPLHKNNPKDFLKTLSPMGTISDVADIVKAVVYLTEARQVTGEVLHVDGGAHAGKW